MQQAYHAEQSGSMLNSITHPYKSPSSHSNQIDQITVYLPGYLRLKFKNFVSLNLQNLSGQMNATLIYTIYYSNVFEQLRQYGATQVDEQNILKKMQNQFVINFANDDSIQLTQGKQDKVKRGKNFVQKKRNDRDDYVKTKRNIEMTVKHEEKQKKQKIINFTMRKNFKVHLKSSVFWTPFQIIDSILQITIQSLKHKIKTGSGKSFAVTFEVNLMDTGYGLSKVSFSESKKFGQYGIVLSGLDAIYSKKMIVGRPEVFDVGTRRLEKQLQQQQNERIINELKEVFGNKKYAHYRKKYWQVYNEHSVYGKICKYNDADNDESKPMISDYNKIRQEQVSKEILVMSNVDKHNEITQSKKTKQQERKFNFKDKIQAYHHVSFKIPLYKFPFTSMATIFLPLWLLAVLNLGVFFQDESLGDRIASIASLALAFIAFIPTIREQIPPSPSIVLIEILVYLIAATSLLALGQSIAVHQALKFVFEDWQVNAWFMISFILNIVVFVIVVVLMVVHYCVWQPRYKRKPESKQKQEKFDRKYWWNRQCEQEFRKKFKDNKISKIQNNKGQTKHIVFEVIDEIKVDNKSMLNQSNVIS